MSQRSESTIASCARSAIQGFAHNITPRTPECTFHTFTRLKSETRFTNASPAPRLRKLKGEDGNNLIEYALVFMFFMSMVLGIVDFSRALYTYHFLSNAAREATRWAAVRGATCMNDLSCTAAASICLMMYPASLFCRAGRSARSRLCRGSRSPPASRPASPR